MDKQEKIKKLEKQGFKVKINSNISLFESETSYTVFDPSGKVILDNITEKQFNKYLKRK